MKDAWAELKILSSQKDEKKANSLTSTPGSAARLNIFYSCFDNEDYSREHSTLQKEFEDKIKSESPIKITESEVYRVLNSTNMNKATGPDMTSAKIIKKRATSLVYIFHSIFNISLQQCRMPDLWKTGEIIPANKKPLPRVNNDQYCVQRAAPRGGVNKLTVGQGSNLLAVVLARKFFIKIEGS